MCYKIWEIDTRKVPLEKLFKWCRRHHGVDRILFGLPTRMKKRKLCNEKQVGNALRLFRDFIIETHEVRSWPGVDYFEGSRPIFVVKITDDLVRAVINAGPYLHHWSISNPTPLPEDLCLFRQGARFPTLTSCAHEDLAWLVSNKTVRLDGCIPSDDKPEQMFYSGPLFCDKVAPCRFRSMKEVVKHCLLNQRKAATHSAA